ncbi:MAG: response regulator, partial [Planctomycetaceae bacterium]|nr:response regulator [Planctomycetaceae bacterium]
SLFVGSGFATGPRAACCQDLQVVRSIDEIHTLPEDRLKDQVPVELQCVLGYYSPGWPITFLHDGRTGMYAVGLTDPQYRSGDPLLIRGLVTPERYIRITSAERSDNGITLPPARPVSWDHLIHRNDDSQYVEVTATLLRVDTDLHHVTLEMLTADGGSFRGLISDQQTSTDALKASLGKSLRLRGIVGARFNVRNEFTGFQIWIPRPADVEVVEGQPGAIEVTSIESLLGDHGTSGAVGFFRVAGRVDYRIADQMMLIHDATGSLLVELKSDIPPQPGRIIEVDGVLDTQTNPPILRFGEMRPSESVIPPEPSIVTLPIADLVSQEFSARIVSTTGEYRGAFQLDNQRGFLLQADDTLLPVFLPDSELEAIEAGTRIRVTGAWVQQRSLIGLNIGSCALYSRRDAILVGTQIPWMVVMGFSTIVVAALALLLWSMTLRRQVRVQTQRVVEAHEIRQQAERHQRELERQLAYVQKMESLGVLAGGIAHDFNNLLTVVIGNAQLLQEFGTLETAQEQCLQQLTFAAQNAAELTRQMLAFAGHGDLDFQVISVSDLIAGTASLLTASVPRSTQLSLCLSDGMLPIRGDASQLRQILMNLVLNASESLEGRVGQVEISTAMVELEAAEAIRSQVSFVDGGGVFVCLKVSDHGGGIAAENLARIFDPFFTTRFSGRGLGLSSVLGIVRSHKGAIRVRSTPEDGTVFEVLLPTTDEPLLPANTARRADLLTRGTGRVLVVDDEPHVRGLLCRILKGAGLETVEAVAGEQALELLKADPGGFACVVTDLTMPGMSGVEVAAAVHRVAVVPVLLCSGYYEPGHEAAEASEWVDRFVRKPFDAAEVVDVVLRLIRSEPKVDDAA